MLSSLIDRCGWTRALVVLAGTLCPVVPALAQTPTRDRPFPELFEPHRWGPFLVERSFVIENIGYDDNIFLVRNDEPKESDFIISLGPEVRAQTRFGPRMSLTLEDRLIGELFLDHPDLNNLDNRFDGQFDVLLGPILLTSTAGWDTSEARPNAEIEDRTRIERRNLEQAIRVFFGGRSDAVFRFGERRIRFKDSERLVRIDPDGTGVGVLVPLGEALNRDDERFAAEIGWQTNGGTRLFVSREEVKNRFESSTVGRDSETDRTYIGAELDAGSLIRGTARIGNAELRPVDPRFGFAPFDDVVSDVQVDIVPTGVTRFVLRHELDIGFSTYDRNLYFEEELLRASFESFVGGRWGLQAGWSQRAVDYPEENTLVQPIGVRRSDTIRNVYGGFVLRIGQGVDLGIRIGERVRDSNIDLFDDDQKYVTTIGSYDF